MDELRQFIETKFQELEQKILTQQKRVLSTEETAAYLGISKGHLYQLTSKGEIPFSRPTVNGKPSRYIYFDRLVLDEWLLSNKSQAHPTTAEIMQNAHDQIIYR